MKKRVEQLPRHLRMSTVKERPKHIRAPWMRCDTLGKALWTTRLSIKAGKSTGDVSRGPRDLFWDLALKIVRGTIDSDIEPQTLSAHLRPYEQEGHRDEKHGERRDYSARVEPDASEVNVQKADEAVDNLFAIMLDLEHSINKWPPTPREPPPPMPQPTPPGLLSKETGTGRDLTI